jgi:hypothetical protein
MTRPRRWRWWGKWATAAITLALAAIWLASGWWVVAWRWGSPTSLTRVSISAGLLCASRVVTTQGLAAETWPGTIHLWRARVYPGSATHITEGEPAPPTWDLELNWVSDPAEAEVWLPLWLPASASLLTALVLFYLDHRRALNACPHCHYDLSATPPSAPCPECGEGGRAQQSPDAEAAEPAARTTP